MILLSQLPRGQDYRCVPLSPSGRDYLLVWFILPWLAVYVPLAPAELDLEDDLRVCQLAQRGNYTQKKKKENYFGRHRIPKEYLWVGNWLWEELPKKWNKGRKQVCYWLCIPHLPTKALLRILLNVIFLEGSELFCSLVADSCDSATSLYCWQMYVGVVWVWLNWWGQNQISCMVGYNSYKHRLSHNGYPIVLTHWCLGFVSTCTHCVCRCMHIGFFFVLGL